MNLHNVRLSFSTIMDLNFGCEIQELSRKEGGDWKRENDKELYCFFPFLRDKNFNVPFHHTRQS